MASRIYKVTTPKGIRLVDASTNQGAFSHVSREEIKVSVASGHEIAELVGQGVKVESAIINGNVTIDEGAAS